MGGSESMTAVALRPVTFSGGSSGFGVSLVVIFCTGTKSGIVLQHSG